MWNLPNILTLTRILLIPVFLVLFLLPLPGTRIACALVFALASITDWLDGFLARRWGQTSAFGAFLDPVADKLMVATALILLVESDSRPLVAVPAVVIIGREITISALREWMAELGARARVAVSLVGKFKTAAQMTAIFLMILQVEIWGLPVYQIGIALIYLATLLTLWSMTVYLKAAWPLLSETMPVELQGHAGPDTPGTGDLETK